MKQEISSEIQFAEWRRLPELFEEEYEQLKRRAFRYVHPMTARTPLGATSLVHATWIKLNTHRAFRFQDRKRFLALAARAMRQVLIDAARAKRACKRGGGRDPARLSSHPARLNQVWEIVAVQDEMEQLGARNINWAQAYELYHFSAMTHEEISSILNISISTVKRHLCLAEDWLTQRRMRSSSRDST